MTDWQWFALRVSPGRELIVDARLREADHFTFLPLRHSLKRRHRLAKGKVLTARAQYPGYVFIGQPPSFGLPWLRILEDPDIHGVIGHDGTPVPIQEPSMVPMVIDRLLLSSRLNGRLQRPKGGRRKKNSQGAAEIVSGPYQGRTVRVIEMADGDPEIFALFRKEAA